MDWRAGRYKARRSVVSPELSVRGTKETRWMRVGEGTLWDFLSRPWSARASIRVLLFVGGTLRRLLRNHPSGGGAGDSVDWRAGRDKARRSIISPELSIGGMKEIRWKRVGDGTRWALRSCPWSASASSRVPLFSGGTFRRPLRNYLSGGAKETLWTGDWDKNRWLVASNRALGTSGRVSSFEAGTLRHPYGMFRRGGAKRHV